MKRLSLLIMVVSCHSANDSSRNQLSEDKNYQVFEENADDGDSYVLSSMAQVLIKSAASYDVEENLTDLSASHTFEKEVEVFPPSSIPIHRGGGISSGAALIFHREDGSQVQCEYETRLNAENVQEIESLTLTDQVKVTEFVPVKQTSGYCSDKSQFIWDKKIAKSIEFKVWRGDLNKESLIMATALVEVGDEKSANSDLTEEEKAALLTNNTHPTNLVPLDVGPSEIRYGSGYRLLSNEETKDHQFVMIAAKKYDQPKPEGGTGSLFFNVEREFQTPVKLVIADQIDVCLGSSGNHKVQVIFTTSEDKTIKCDYKGRADRSHVEDDEKQIRKGQAYNFLSCDGDEGLLHGDSLLTKKMQLKFGNGDSDTEEKATCIEAAFSAVKEGNNINTLKSIETEMQSTPLDAYQSNYGTKVVGYATFMLTHKGGLLGPIQKEFEKSVDTFIPAQLYSFYHAFGEVFLSFTKDEKTLVCKYSAASRSQTFFLRSCDEEATLDGSTVKTEILTMAMNTDEESKQHVYTRITAVDKKLSKELKKIAED